MMASELPDWKAVKGKLDGMAELLLAKNGASENAATPLLNKKY